MFLGSLETQLPSDRLRVMIVDDVMETRRSTRLMLTLIPEVEVVAIAHNGRQAVEMTQTHRPDVALMDVQMPEMDGLAAIEKMMQIRPEMVCVVISAERDRETLRQAMRAGARDYLVKPFTAEQLTEVMERVIAEVRANRAQRLAAAGPQLPLDAKRKVHLQKLASRYLQARRTDDEVVAVLEELATDPACEASWLTGLSMLYLVRRQWGKLKLLAERLEMMQAQTVALLA